MHFCIFIYMFYPFFTFIFIVTVYSLYLKINFLVFTYKILSIA